MPTLTLELPPQEEQTAHNLRRWEEVLADPDLQKVPGRVETDRHGRIIMSPPPAPQHGDYQITIGALLRTLLPDGRSVGNSAVSTADGVKGVDVAWVRKERRPEVRRRACFLRAPEICVEIISPSNSEREIREKMELYFDAGAEEVWICGSLGEMSFYGRGGKALPRSEICPDFPTSID